MLSPELAANGRIQTRMGNRLPYAAPHGAFPCQSEDRWCDIEAAPSFEEFGDEVRVIYNDDDKLVNAVETKWYREIKEKLTPGDVMRIYRENRMMTHARLGELLEGIPRQHVSNMENGKRQISLNTARKLSKLFNIPIERLLT